jgi:peptidoglycan-N-acetylglucosamine deacetylase
VSLIASEQGRASTALGAAALLALGGYWLPSACLVSAQLRRVLGVRATVGAGEVALTFDDGPHPEGTPAVLEVLEAHNARATFFLVGEQVRRRPALAARVAAGGHAVGVHCDVHRGLMRLTPRQVAADLERAFEAIGAATGRAPGLYRPPYGILTAPALLQARRRGWTTVLWRQDGHDWDARATAHSIASRLGAFEPGDILLLHDSDAYGADRSWERTAAALPHLLAEIRRRNLRPERVPLAEGASGASAPGPRGFVSHLTCEALRGSRVSGTKPVPHP